MIEILQWAISAQAAVMLWLMGNSNKLGPVVGLFGQTLWIAYCLITKQWGLLPGIAGFTLVHARNFLKLQKAELTRRKEILGKEG